MKRALVVVLVVAGLVAGCGGHNASIQGRDYGSAKVLNEPHGFENVAVKCDGYGHRVFVTDSNGDQSSSVAVINDANCRGATGP